MARLAKKVGSEIRITNGQTATPMTCMGIETLYRYSKLSRRCRGGNPSIAGAADEWATDITCFPVGHLGPPGNKIYGGQ
jgi:hypothetical protein